MPFTAPITLLTCSALIAVLPIASLQAGNLLKTIHVDHSFRYLGGDWEIVIHGNDGDPDLDPDETVLIVIDGAFPADGGRATRPAGARWDFLGADANEDVWIIPQAFTPLLWPGWRSEGNFAPYFNNDPRLGFDSPFVRVSLVQAGYSGVGDGHFSIWSNQTGGNTKVWVSTADGISDEDAYYFSSGHSHTNLGFSDPGVYQIDYQASAFLSNSGGNPLVGTNPVASPVQSFYYAVGTYAEWKATHYQPIELVDQDPTDDTPEIAHYDSDTDKDGVTLLLEYAFNLSPVKMDRQLLNKDSGTQGLPLVYLDDSGDESKVVIEYVRRRAEGAPRLNYRPQFSSTLDDDWTDASSETIEPIDTTWERVRAVDTVSPEQEAARFGRVLVELE